jgi:ATP-dependent exoDNAse (exonuclease V) alpha subunit
MTQAKSFSFYLDIQNNEADIGKCINKTPPKTQIILGRAGTGKSYYIKNLVLENPTYCLLSAPTGIAAINLDTRTINSVLKFFDTKQLIEKYKSTKLHELLENLKQRYDNLGIDEMSMLGSKKGDVIVEAIADVNKDSNKNLGLILTGDFAQLPPVNEEYLFEGNSWPLISDNILKLDKIYRQDNLEFIEALSLCREGNGNGCLQKLLKLKVSFTTNLDYEFDGTTIMGTNKVIDIFNERRFNNIDEKTIRVHPVRRGSQLSEWDEHIPLEMRFKKSSYVMVLTNDTENWEYINGDCGWVVDYEKATNSTSDNDAFYVKLKRNNSIVRIPRILRQNLVDDEPPKKAFTSMFIPKPDHKTNQWIIGTISYHPLRLAYCSSVHKSQGLSLDKVQIDIRANNFNYPHMIYVALSRAKRPEDLVIVGTRNDFVYKIRTDERIRKWI